MSVNLHQKLLTPFMGFLSYRLKTPLISSKDKDKYIAMDVLGKLLSAGMEKGLIHGISLPKDNTHFVYNMFINDTTVIMEVNLQVKYTTYNGDIPYVWAGNEVTCEVGRHN